MKDLGAGLLAIIGGAFTLALVSVVLSRNAATGQVIQASATGLSQVIAAAVKPVSSPGVGASGASFSPAAFSQGFIGQAMGLMST